MKLAILKSIFMLLLLAAATNVANGQLCNIIRNNSFDEGTPPPVIGSKLAGNVPFWVAGSGTPDVYTDFRIFMWDQRAFPATNPNLSNEYIIQALSQNIVKPGTSSYHLSFDAATTSRGFGNGRLEVILSDGTNNVVIATVPSLTLTMTNYQFSNITASIPNGTYDSIIIRPVANNYPLTMDIIVDNIALRKQDSCTELVVKKFRDANANGVFDAGDSYISNWPIEVSPGVLAPQLYFTGSLGAVDIPPTTIPFIITELNKPWYIPISPSSGSYTYTGGAIPAGGLEFGNYQCPNVCENVNDMIAFLHMEESTLSAGSPACNLINSNGSITAGTAATSVAGPPGNGNAIQFSSGSTISIPYYPEMDFGPNSFSADAYINLSLFGSKQVIVSHMGTSGSNQKGWSFYAIGGRLGFEMQNGFGGSYSWNPSGTAWFSLNTWYHVGFVYNGVANTIALYVDGVAKAGTLGLGPWKYNLDNTAPMMIGSNFTGVIDEVSVYNRNLSLADMNAILVKTKCREYMKIDLANGGCVPGQTNAVYTATVINGDANTNNFKYAFAGLDGGGACTVNGPKGFSPASGSFTLSGCKASNTVTVSMPCNATHSPGTTGCFALTVWNQTAGRCALEDAQGTSLNQMYRLPTASDEYEDPRANIVHDGTRQIILPPSGAGGTVYVSVAPNPFTGQIQLMAVLDKESQATVSVFDMLGREVIEAQTHFFHAGNNQLSLDAQELASGVYMLKVTVGSQVINTRLVKE